jgi:putative oxidoreductase
MPPIDTTYGIRTDRHASQADKLYTVWAPKLLSVLRIITGFLFIAHGTQKLLGFPAGPDMRQPELMSLPGLAGILELFGGALILVGLFTRPVAFVLSGFMAVAYFMAHAPQGFWPILNRGELAALYSFLFLYLAAAGGGEWSLDRLLRSRT